MSAARAAARTGFFQRFHIGPRTLRSQGISIENVRPVYDCGKVPWWARWTYFLVVADIFITATACELSWSHWTMWEELPQESDSPSSSTSPPRSEAEVVGHYVLRPWWQRGMFAASSLVMGVGLAGVLIGARSRVVRRMYIISNAASKRIVGDANRLLVIQSPLHLRQHGAVYPLHRTRLVNNPKLPEMMIGLKDERGHYSVPLEGAEVNGLKLSPWDAKMTLYKIWYGAEHGARMYTSSAKVPDEGSK
ncbi:hypothetical protein C8Q80DRAFT_1217523 [Daedaleopsis nitida]|nr:hypothetical protein C8Q80DRAFT_1217523 [Daedaleopsis nitida]